MKVNSKSSIVKICLALLTLASCESHEQKADEAFNHFKEEKTVSNDSNLNDLVIKEEIKKIAIVKKNENLDDWTKFKMKMEKKMFMNENLIKQIKDMPDQSSKFYRKVTSLEKDNINLNKKMDKYKEEMKANFDKFQLDINQNIDEINNELKDMTKKNKK